MNRDLINCYNSLLRQYRLRLIEIEINLHKRRGVAGNTKIQRYFNSTQIRNTFARWMVHAVYTNKHYNITQLAKGLNTNRQTISSIIKDCEGEGYIVVRRVGKTTNCKASTILVEKMEDYCEWRRDLSKDIWESLLALNTFEKYTSKK